MHRKTLFVTLTTRETILGFGLLALYLAASLLLPERFLPSLLICGAALFLLRRFLRESVHMPLMPLSGILWKAALAAAAAQLINLLMNDLFFPFFPEYFIYGETGPAFYNVQKAALAAAAGEQFFLTFLRAAVLVPVAEELLYRGVLFGTLHDKWGWPAYPVTALLYALVATVPLIGSYPTDFVILHFLQTLPLSLIFGWVYTSSDTILTPLFAHIVLNAVSVLPMR